MEDDLSMISTTQVPSGERGGASLAGSVRSSGVLRLALLVDVDVVLAGNPDEAAALLDVLFERRLGGRRNGLHVPVVDHHELEIVEFRRARRRAPAAPRTGWRAARAEMCSSLAAGSCETSRTRGLRSVTESSKRASPRPSARDLAGQSHGADRIDQRLQAHMIHAGSRVPPRCCRSSCLRP